MRQLKNYSAKDDKEKKEAKAKKINQTPPNESDVRDYISKYDGFSEDQLIEELVKSVKKAKDSGTYSDEQMKTFINLVSPQMSKEQSAKLDNLVKLLDEEEF